MSEPAVKRRPFVEEYIGKDGGRSVIVLGEGRLINLAAAEGHPASVMDMSFANQAMAAAYLAQNYKSLEKKVYSVPTEIDEEVALLKLAAMKITIRSKLWRSKVNPSGWNLRPNS